MSDSLWQRLTRGRRVIRAEPEWETFAGPRWADRIMTEEVADRFHAKQGRSIGRWTLTVGGRQLVVYLKRHYVLPRWHGLMSVFFPRRAWSPGLEEWDHLAWARANQFPVPRTPAVGELLGPWGKLQSFLAVEELTGMLALHEAIPLAEQRLSASEFARWKRGLIVELVRLARELHGRQAFHQDLYLCHFYVPEADTNAVPAEWQGRVWMIDFHRLTHRRLAWQWWQVKDLAQLLYSTFGVSGITPRDRARFWKLYGTTKSHWIKRAARWKADRYHRHNARKANPR